MKTIAIIGSGILAANISDVAKKMGVRSISFSNVKNDLVCDHCDKFYEIDIFNTDKIISICKEEKVNGVISTTELTVSVTAQIAEKLGLNGLNYEISKSITNKAYVRKMASVVCDLSQPKFKLIDDITINEWNIFPAIVKPTCLSGKRGITVINNKSELNEAIKYAHSAFGNKKSEIMIEEYISDGIEYSVESLSYHGKSKVIQITRKISSGPPHCVELGHIQPANLSNEICKKIKKVIPELLNTLGIDNTSSHTEIKIHDEKIFLIEVNARYGGDFIAYPLTNLSTGFSYIGSGIKIAFDEFEFEEINNRKNCGILLVVKETAFLKEIFDECTKYSWLYKKNYISDELVSLINNNANNNNYFIFCSDNGIPNEIYTALTNNNLL